MNSDKITQNLLQSISFIANQVIKTANYDKTVQATIISCVDQTIGKYKVKYQDGYWYAYSLSSESTYTKGSNVYILIPNGNMNSNNKVIIGSTEKLGTNYIHIIKEEDNYNEISSNIITDSTVHSLCSYASQTLTLYKNYNNQFIDYINLNTDAIEQYIKLASFIKISMYIKTILPIQQRYNGNYGIKFYIDFQDSSTNEIITRVYTFDIDLMNGNPYLFNDGVYQNCIFEIDGQHFVKIRQIDLFVEDFPIQQQDHPADIFISKVNLAVVQPLSQSEKNGVSLNLIAKQGYIFTAQDLASTERKIQAQVKLQTKIVNSIEQLAFYWFVEDGSITTQSSYYSQYGGRGWKCLNNYNIIKDSSEDNKEPLFSFNAGPPSFYVKKSDVSAQKTRYKCVVIYDNNVISKEFIIINKDFSYIIDIESSQGTDFNYNVGEPDLTCIVKDNLNEEQDINDFQFVWSVINSNNNYTLLEETTDLNSAYAATISNYNNFKSQINNESILKEAIYEGQITNIQHLEDLSLQVERLKKQQRVYLNNIYSVDISQIINFSIYKCSVFSKTDNKLIGTANITLTNNLNNVQNTYKLIINNGTQNFNYSQAGIAPTSQSLVDPYVIPALSFTILDERNQALSKKILQNCIIKWIVPKKNTMINISNSYEAAEVNEQYNIYEKMLDLPYTIAQKFSANKNNNDIQLEVIYNDLKLFAQTNLVFSKQGYTGTNGTDYQIKIVPYEQIAQLTDYPMITVDYNESHTTQNWNHTTNRWFDVELWHNGERIFKGNQTGTTEEQKSITIEWGILKNRYKVNSNEYFDNTCISINQNTGKLSFSSGFLDKSPANIIKAQVIYDGLIYYATLPIIFLKKLISTDVYSAKLKKNTGFRQVVYKNDGTQPSYNDLVPFEIIVKNNNEDISLNIINNVPSYTYSMLGSYYHTVQKTTKNESNLIYINSPEKNKCYVKPSDKYDGKIVNNAIGVTIKIGTRDTLFLHIPINLYLNRYNHSALNSWNGNNIELGTNNGGMILAPQMGAGYKQNDNSFTGIVMGQVKGDPITPEQDMQTGLFGYKSGERTIFLDADTGKAVFGKQGSGQIIMDPSQNQAIIKSGDYDTNAKKGMQINLTTPEIRFGSGNFIVNKDGIVTLKGAIIDNNSDIEGLNDLQEDISALQQSIASIQNQMDGVIETYSGSDVPTLNNQPAKNWTENTDKDVHIGDLYYVDSDNPDGLAGSTYRFQKKSDGQYEWVLLQDNQLAKVLSDIEDLTDDLEATNTQITNLSQNTTNQITALSNNLSSNYYSRTDVDGQINDKLNNALSNYSTTAVTQSAINQAADNITASVSSTYATKSQAVASQTVHYLASSRNSGVTKADTETDHWTTTPQQVTSSKRYLWMYITYTKVDQTSEDGPVFLAGAWGNKGSTGAAGAAGAKTAIVYLYKRSAQSISSIDWSNSLTYNFANKTLNSVPNGWSLSIPSGTDPVYVTAATAYGTGDSDDIQLAEWSTPILLVKNGEKGDSGTGINSVNVYYGISDSPSEQPLDNNWNSNIPEDIEEGQYLWTKTVIDYTDSTIEDTITYTYARQGIDGIEGAPGSSVTITSIKYLQGDSPTVIPQGNWSDTVVPVAEGKYLWTQTTYSDGRNAYSVAKQGISGVNGADGINTATVYLYKRSSTQPTDKPDNLTYNFAGRSFIGNLNNWNTTVPIGGEGFIWAIFATASSSLSSDVIPSTEWSNPIRLEGQPGVQGASGLNQATILLYQRSSNSSLSKPLNTPTYTFATGQLSQIPQGWSRTIPATDGNPCYVTSTSVISKEPTVTITSWTDVVKLVQDGIQGEEGSQFWTSSTSPTSLKQDGVTKYVFNISALTGNPNATVKIGDIIYQSVYRFTIIAVNTDSAKVTTYPRVSIKGSAGSAGVSTVTVYLYKKSNQKPVKPSSDLTYRFSDNVITNIDEAGGWQLTVPTGTDPLWLTIATASASANTSTDNIPSSEWSDPIKIEGIDGKPGDHGLNQATIFLYTRSSTLVNTKPANNMTYTFSTGTLTPIPQGWSRTIPVDDGNPCYMTSATAISASDSYIITSERWTDVIKLIENGRSTNTATVFLYKRAASSPNKLNITSTYDFTNGVLSVESPNTLNQWQQTIPSLDGNPCWVSQATAISNTDTAIIGNDAWSTPVQFTDQAKNIDTIYPIYYAKNSEQLPAQPENIVTDNTGGVNKWTTKMPDLEVNYPYLYTCNQVTYTDGTWMNTNIIYDSNTVDLKKRITSAESQITDDAIISTVMESTTYINSTNIINLLPSIYQKEFTSKAGIGQPVVSNGITWILNADGSVTATGVATAVSTYFFNERTLDNNIPAIILDATKTYIFHGCPTGGDTSSYSLAARVTKKTDSVLVPTSSSGNVQYDTGAGKIIKNYNYIALYARIAKNYNIDENFPNGITFYPMLQVGEQIHNYVSTHNGTGALLKRVETAESNITQNATEIQLKVSNNIDGAKDIVSYINQTANKIYLQATQIQLNGNVISDIIKSSNYIKDDDEALYSSIGTCLDMKTGDIYTPYFRVKNTQKLTDRFAVGAYIHGEIQALTGSIGNKTENNYWRLGNFTYIDSNDKDYNIHTDIAGMIGYRNVIEGTNQIEAYPFIQTGNWMISGNKINTQHFEVINSNDTISYIKDVHENSTENRYYDYGMYAATSFENNTNSPINNAVFYIRRSKGNSVPTTESEWEYLFRVTNGGTIYAADIILTGTGDSPYLPKTGGEITNNLKVNGTLSGTSLTMSGSISGASLTVSGNISGTLANSISINGQSFNNSTSITIGTISPSYGGTGKTSLKDSANALIDSLDMGVDTDIITDNMYIITQNTTTSSSTYYKRKSSKIWDYIKAKISSEGLDISKEYRQLNNNIFDTIDTTTLNVGSLLVTGAARFINGLYGDLTGTATEANKVKNNLIIKLNSGTIEGTDLFTYNGSVIKEINITPAALNLDAFSGKAIDTLISSSSSNIPTSAAVVNYINSQGYVTSSGVTSITLNAGDGISLDSSGAITSSGSRTITNSGVRSITKSSSGDVGKITVDTNGTSSDVQISGLDKIVSSITISGNNLVIQKADNSSPQTLAIDITGQIVTGATALSDSQGELISIGGATTPVYFSNGLPVAGNTIPQLNGNTSGGDFYAPTNVGTKGYILVSNNPNTPIWANPTTLTVGKATTADTATTANTATTATTADTATIAITANSVAWNNVFDKPFVYLGRFGAEGEGNQLSLNDIDFTTADYKNKIVFLQADANTLYKPGWNTETGGGGLNGNIINIGWDNTKSSNKYGVQILFSNGTSTGQGSGASQLYIRGRHLNDNWDNWRIMLTDVNWSTYITKSGLGLGNVDNTADVDKHVAYAESAESASKDDEGNDISITYAKLSGATFTGVICADDININATKSKTTGGLGLFGNSSGLNYSIMMRGTDTAENGLGTHGYVTGDWATYFNQASTSGHLEDRGWIFRAGLKDTGVLPVASISSLGQAVFNGSVTVGGNAANNSGCRLEYSEELKCLNFVFN